MQRCNCSVRLGGDIGNTVAKTGVSPAEIVILRHIHGGPDAVIDIQPTGMDKVPHAVERERLVNIYKAEIVDHLFPGAYSKLPVSLSDVALVEEDVTDLGESGQPEVANEADPILSSKVTPDDQELIDKVLTAKTKAELRDMAEENEVSLDGVADKMDDMQKAIIKGLFPNYEL